MKSLPPLLNIREGATITHDGKEFVILALADLNVVLAKEIGSDSKAILKIGELGPPKYLQEKDENTQQRRELLAIPDESWEQAQEKLNLIQPLLNNHYRRTGPLVEKIAEAAGVSRATVYRWVSAYRSTGQLSSLIPNTDQRGGKDKGRISAEVEALIEQAIEDFHNTDQRQSIAETIVDIRRRCSNAGLKLPAASTIRKRLEWTDGRERLLRRKGEAAANKRYDPVEGSIPDADWPLAMVQMDHTLLPIMIVDDVYRKPIKRVWITLAIDVYSRMCLGMCLSLDPPSAMSAGMCISHAVLPKERWLNRLGITTVDWPAWGTMGILHLDNAREFRGNMLRMACKEYDIDLHLRPVKKPRYGAHIERLMGTVSEGLKTLKGTTFSGPSEKGEYDAEGNACMTFSDVEKWLVLFFARYHKGLHRGINTSPLTKWREGLLGTKERPGRGLPARRLDEEQLRINFMPYYERTIQNYGVVLDNVHYYHDVLRPWINTPDPEFPKHHRKFRFHRDPRDIGRLYFYDEHAKRHFAIPYRDTSLPPVSIWELRDAHRKADERGISRDDERAIFSIINEQRKIEAAAAEKTKFARREQQRRAQHTKARENRKEELPTVSNVSPSVSIPEVPGYDPDSVILLDDE